MPPRISAIIPSASRRAKRVIDSASPSPSPSPPPPSSPPYPPRPAKFRGAVREAKEPASSVPTNPRSRGVKRTAPYVDDDEDEDEDDDDEDEEDEEEDEEEGEEVEEEEVDDEEDEEVDDEEEGVEEVVQGEDEEMEVVEDDGEGEDEGENDAEEGADQDLDLESEGEAMDVDEEEEEQVEEPPQQAVRIKFKVSNKPAAAVPPPRRARTSAAALAAGPSTGVSGAGQTSAAGGSGQQQGGKKSKKPNEMASEDEMDFEDEEGGEGVGEGDDDDEESSRMSWSPSKLTARQRAKGNKDMQETLLVLPDVLSKKALVLTDQEKLERKEEAARRRRRQVEQKQQDEQDETINRLLRAQTSRSRAKLDNPSPALDSSGDPSAQPSPIRRVPVLPASMVRWSSTLGKDGEVVLRVAAPKGKDEWLDLGERAVGREAEGDVVAGAKMQRGDGRCAAPGCGEARKYRSVKKFEVGGCCMEHLKVVEAAL